MAGFHPPDIDYTLLHGRSATVTGGASGLGEATVIKFAEYGAYVTIADMQDDLGHILAKRLTDQGKKVRCVYCDTTEYQSSVAGFQASSRLQSEQNIGHRCLVRRDRR